MRESAAVRGRFVLAAVLACGGWACGGGAQGDARKAGEQWLKLVDGAQYEQTWDEASHLLKEGVDRKYWASSLKESRERRGPLVSRELLGMEYRQNHEYSAAKAVVDVVVVSYRATFKNKAASKEQLAVVREPDGAWRVYLYLSGMAL